MQLMNLNLITFEQSQLYQHYKSMYEFNWLKFLLIYYFILDSLLFLSEKFVILIFLVLFLFFIEYTIRTNLILKYKAYCHGLTTLPQFEPVEKCFLYYCEFVKVLFFCFTACLHIQNTTLLLQLVKIYYLCNIPLPKTF